MLHGVMLHGVMLHNVIRYLDGIFDSEISHLWPANQILLF